jgi:Co/Zn/Cd efflux system component
MTNMISTYFPHLVLLLLVVLLISLWACTSAIKELRSTLPILSQQIKAVETVAQEISERFRKLESSMEVLANYSESTSGNLHVLAAHFVPSVRTEADAQREFDYSELASHGYDVESRFYAKQLDK